VKERPGFPIPGGQGNPKRGNRQKNLHPAGWDLEFGIWGLCSAMQTPEITAYLKTHCGWSAGVRAVLAKYNLKYTEKDIIQNPAFRWEMETKSGQPLSPCVEVNGTMLPDVSGEDLEKYFTENRLVEQSNAEAGVPLNAPCANEQHGEVKLKL
jgi:glutaredoxin